MVKPCVVEPEARQEYETLMIFMIKQPLHHIQPLECVREDPETQTLHNCKCSKPWEKILPLSVQEIFASTGAELLRRCDLFAVQGDGKDVM